MALVKSTLSGINPPEKTRIQVTDTVLADADASLTVEQLLGFLLTMVPTAPRTLILPSAGNIVTALANATVADAIQFQVRNFGVSTITVVPQGALSGQAVVGPGSYKTFLLRLDDVNSLSATYTLNDEGTSGGAPGAGDVVGAGASTDDALVRYDGVTGTLIQNSGAILDDGGNLTGLNDVTIGGDLTAPGVITLGAASLIYPAADGGAGNHLITDGGGNLSFAAIPGGGDVVGPGAGSANNAVAIFDGVTGLLLKQTDLAVPLLSFSDANLNNLMGTNAVTAPAGSQNNVGFGNLALSSLTTADQNVAIGNGALAGATSGGSNVAVGHTALTSLTSGLQNTAVGFDALDSLIGGSNNTAVGATAAQALTSGSGNTAIGDRALFANTNTSNNTAVGNNAMANVVGGTRNVAMGVSAMAVAGVKTDNVVVGNLAAALTTGSDNVILGSAAAPTTSTGSENVLVGSGAATAAAATSQSIGIGAGILLASRPATDQIVFDTDSSQLNVQALFVPRLTSSAGPFGTGTLRFNNATGEIQEVTGALGDVVGPAASTADAVVVFDGATGKLIKQSNAGSPVLLFHSTADDNMVMGESVVITPGASSGNTGYGRSVLIGLTTGDNNVIIGRSSATLLTTGSTNVVVGSTAMGAALGATDNVVLGPLAAPALTSGGNNVCVGRFTAGTLTTGSRNTLVGNGADVTAAASTRAIAIGAGASGVSAAASEEIVFDGDIAHGNVQLFRVPRLTTTTDPTFGTGTLRYINTGTTGEVRELAGSTGLMDNYMFRTVVRGVDPEPTVLSATTDTFVTVVLSAAGLLDQTLTLPLISTLTNSRKIYVIKDSGNASGTRNIFVTPTGPDTINPGGASFTIITASASVSIYADATAGAWQVF